MMVQIFKFIYRKTILYIIITRCIIQCIGNFSGIPGQAAAIAGFNAFKPTHMY